MTFNEYIASRLRAALPDPVTMLARLGISPGGPHEVEVMRLVKDEKKRAAQAPSRNASGAASTTRMRGLPRSGPAAM